MPLVNNKKLISGKEVKLFKKISEFLSSCLGVVSFVGYTVRSLRDFFIGFKQGWEESKGNPKYDKKEFQKITKEFLDNE